MDLETLADDIRDLDQARQVIRELVALVQAQQAQNEELLARIEELERDRGQSSRNSSRPPSSDSPAQRHKRRSKPRSERQQGAQPGHKKHERRLLPEQEVDDIQRYYPESRCSCGGTLAMEETPAFRHQVFDLPKVRYTVTEHQLYSGCCERCGQKQTARTPEWVPAGQMGPGLISTIVQLAGQFHLSVRQIQAFLREQWQLSFSIGAISQAQGKSNPWLAVPYQQIGEKIRQAPVAHADETRHYRGSEQRWLWGLVTQHLCYFMVHYSRGKLAANELLRNFSGYLVTDHYSGYNDVPRDRRQLCWAHLVRHFRQISERPGMAGKIGERLLLIALMVFRTRDRHPPSDHPWRYRRRMDRLRKSFKATLQQGRELQLSERTANQCHHLQKDEAMCWTFLNHPDIPLTNNEAERDPTVCDLAQAVLCQPVLPRRSVPAHDHQHHRDRATARAQLCRPAASALY